MSNGLNKPEVNMGYYGGGSWTGCFVILALLLMVIGWGVIEGLGWLLSFVHISFGK
jgi:hypothetical protein